MRRSWWKLEEHQHNIHEKHRTRNESEILNSPLVCLHRKRLCQCMQNQMCSVSYRVCNFLLRYTFNCHLNEIGSSVYVYVCVCALVACSKIIARRHCDAPSIFHLYYTYRIANSHRVFRLRWATI